MIVLLNVLRPSAVRSDDDDDVFFFLPSSEVFPPSICSHSISFLPSHPSHSSLNVPLSLSSLFSHFNYSSSCIFLPRPSRLFSLLPLLRTALYLKLNTRFVPLIRWTSVQLHEEAVLLASAGPAPGNETPARRSQTKALSHFTPGPAHFAPPPLSPSGTGCPGSCPEKDVG